MAATPKKASTTIFEQLFDEFAKEGSAQAANRCVRQLTEAQKRVRRALDRGAPRQSGAAMKKAIAALTTAREALPALTSKTAR